MNKIYKSLKNINWELFLSLLVMGLIPTIYTTVRVFFIGQLPGDWSFSIAGQLSWVNLIYEILKRQSFSHYISSWERLFLIRQNIQTE